MSIGACYGKPRSKLPARDINITSMSRNDTGDASPQLIFENRQYLSENSMFVGLCRNVLYHVLLRRVSSQSTSSTAAARKQTIQKKTSTTKLMYKKTKQRCIYTPPPLPRSGRSRYIPLTTSVSTSSSAGSSAPGAATMTPASGPTHPPASLTLSNAYSTPSTNPFRHSPSTPTL